MGAIIKLVCGIKTKNHVNTVQNFTFQSVNYEYNALFSFVFSKLGSYGYFPCCTSSYIKRMCLAIYRIYACSDTTKSTRNGGCTCVTAICEEVTSL